jgi:hypothetical protein
MPAQYPISGLPNPLTVAGLARRYAPEIHARRISSRDAATLTANNAPPQWPASKFRAPPP